MIRKKLSQLELKISFLNDGGGDNLKKGDVRGNGDGLTCDEHCVAGVMRVLEVVMQEMLNDNLNSGVSNNSIGGMSGHIRRPLGWLQLWTVDIK